MWQNQKNNHIVANVLLMVAGVLILALIFAIFKGIGIHPNDNAYVRDSQSVANCGQLMDVEYKGHYYIVYDGPHKGGITHSPDCPCLK